MTYTHITYPTGEEFLFNHGAMDDGQVCHGDLLAVNLRGQWESAGNTPVIINTGNESTGEGVRTTDEVREVTLPTPKSTDPVDPATVAFIEPVKWVAMDNMI